MLEWAADRPPHSECCRSTCARRPRIIHGRSPGVAILAGGPAERPDRRPSADRLLGGDPAGEARVAEQLDRRLARQAVQQGRLTLWQAQQLLAGRSSGFQIDRYVLLDLIGQGGMGRVYLARDTRLNRRVALEDPLARADEQPPGHRAVPARGAGRGAAPAREPRPDLRRGRGQRQVLPRDGVHRGEEHRRADRRARADARRRPPPGWPGRSRWGWSTPSRRA